MLNMTKEELELIPDHDIYIFVEKGTRGGVSYISNRYSKSNNKYLRTYDPKQESKHIIYLDTNNLYGYAMYKFLPTSGFKWIAPKEFDLNKYNSNISKGCVLEVDREYPKELQELHNDYPLAADKIEIKREMLSHYQLKVADLYNIPIGNVKKLVPNFFDKEKEVIYYENLQLYSRWGLKLKKHISCIRTQWLKQYDEFNTHKRIEAEKNGDKDGKALSKLMNNAAYGKTMENLRNRVGVKFISNEKEYLKSTSEPSYVIHKIFDIDLLMIRKNEVTLTLNKPTHMGMCVLELNKVLMNEFHYD